MVPHAPGARAGWWLAAAGTAVFVVVLVMVETGTLLARLDAPVLDWMVAHRTPAWTAWNTFVSHLFGGVVLPLAVGVGCVVWWRVGRDLRRPVLLAAAMLAQLVLSLVAKSLVARPRPPDVQQVVPGAVVTHSYPSGHTMAAATLAFTLLVLVGAVGRSRRWWWVGAVLAAAVTTVVAVSRLYLGYHFLTDVVGGAGLGVAVVGLVVVAAVRVGLVRVGPGVVAPAGTGPGLPG